MRARLMLAWEDGQALLLTTVSLFVIMTVAAFVVDAATWYQKHHQAQVAADAASLAAANCLANAASGKTCTSTTDTSDAATVATQFAAANGLSIPTSDVSFTGSKVSVTTPVSAPTLFARIAGIRSATTSAQAVAAYTPGSSTSSCTAAAQSADQCTAVYAANASCAGSAGFISGSSNLTVGGAIHSQGYMSFPQGTYTFQGPVTYSSGNCTPNEPQPGDFKANSPTLGGNESPSFWPDDYSSYFTSCSGSACTGPGGTPSYCNYAAASYQFSWSSYPPSTTTAPSGVYCAYGTGTPSNPSTWNGSLDFNSSFTPSSPESLTLIGGSIDFNGSATLSPAVDGCLMYVTDTDSQSGQSGALYVDGGNQALSGGLFAPNGTIYISQTGNSSGFLEAQNVNLSGLTAAITGDGPVLSGGGSSSGTDSLIQ